MKKVPMRGNDDCLVAALASVLEVPYDKIPHFVEKHGDAWYRPMNEWLSKNFGIVGFTIKQNPDNNENHVSRALWGRYIALVDRPQGLHAIVCENGKVVWDPCSPPAENEQDPDDWLYMLFMATDPEVFSSYMGVMRGVI